MYYNVLFAWVMAISFGTSRMEGWTKEDWCAHYDSCRACLPVIPDDIAGYD